MSRFVTAMPVLSRWRCHSPGEEAPFPFGDPRASRWHCARTAIWQGVRQLGLATGDRILAPAYSCGSEVDALLGAGLELDFYRIDEDLAVDLDHVRMLCRTPARAIYVTHYFGFPQPMPEILAFAQEQGLLVMEDNAHGLYSVDARGMPLGSLGDAGVFSFPKTYPVPDGGALVLNGRGPGGVAPPDSERPALRPVAGRMKFLAGESLAARFPGGKKPSTDPEDRPQEPDPGAEARLMRRIRFDPGRVRWRMSAPTRMLLASAGHARTRDRRRANFVRLLESVPDEDRARPLFRRLPDGCCPLFYPVQSPDSRGLQRFLLERRIESKRIWSFSHPALPESGFPREEELKRRVVALPVHQDLDVRDMERIGEAMYAWLRSAS